MSPLIKYTTSIPAVKSAGEIQGILAAHGANAVLMEYEEWLRLRGWGRILDIIWKGG